jgi:hypothetical protein
MKTSDKQKQKTKKKKKILHLDYRLVGLIPSVAARL